MRLAKKKWIERARMYKALLRNKPESAAAYRRRFKDREFTMALNAVR
jgi:hypothetical protein